MILETISKGSTYQGLVFTINKKNGDTREPLDLSTATVKMTVKDKYDTNVLTLTSPDGLVISENTVTFPPQVINLKAGNYRFDIKIKLSETEVATGIASGTWTITQPITE